MDDSQAIRQIAAAEDEGAVFAVARAFFRTQGFAALSYARPSRTDPGRSEVTSFGFPEGFVASYRERLAEYEYEMPAGYPPSADRRSAYEKRQRTRGTQCD